jgi:pimeloyl-ACP methyl ester carboxylesterase
MAITRRQFGIATGALAALASRNAPLAAQTATTPPPVLDIAEWTFRFYGVEHALLARGTVCNGMQMFVEHWIPTVVRHPYPVVLIHGGYGQGSDWYSTPDGRRGLALLLLEQGYKVYVIDRPGQGRNPYQPFVHGQFDREALACRRAGNIARLIAELQAAGATPSPATRVLRLPSGGAYSRRP